MTLFLFATQMLHAQNILDNNLIVNGGAEGGPAGTATTLVSAIPGWTRTGSANVLPYDLTGQLLLSNPAPMDHGFNYFAAGGSNGTVSTLAQDIDVSSGASTINGGNINYTASAYLGSRRIGVENENFTAEVAFAFKNAGGQTISTVRLGPIAFFWGAAGISLQRQIGLVPVGTVRITVTQTLVGPFASADSLSIILTPLGTTPGTVLGTNLVVNGGAEAGPGLPITSIAPYVPGWSTKYGATVAPYGGSRWIAPSDPTPVDRGVNLFAGWVDGSSSYQDIDVAPAASLIDAGQVTYQISAWLGGIASNQSPTLTYTFFDWSDKPLATIGKLVAAGHAGTALVQTSHADTLPPGTRRVRIDMSFASADSLADNIVFTLDAPSGPPVITAAGIVSAGAFGGFPSIAPGSWIEIYGTFLAQSTRSWLSSDIINGVAPISLDGVSVSIGGKAAYLDYISSGQINALVPSDAPTGTVPVTVTNANGISDKFWLIVNPTQPGLLAPSAFIVGGKQYVAALFSDGQTFALTQNAIAGVPSRPAKPGETLTIFGIGFGPVTPAITAGTIVTQQNSLTTPIQMTFGTALATLPYYGLAPSFTGLYQLNVVVPSVASNNALPISFSLGGVKGSQTLYISVQN
jgi:uncharacterized protein (TIGR03437 family)